MGVFHPLEKNYHWININSTPQFLDGEEKPFQVYTTFEDITEQKQAERRQVLASKILELLNRWGEQEDIIRTIQGQYLRIVDEQVNSCLASGCHRLIGHWLFLIVPRSIIRVPQSAILTALCLYSL